MEIKDVQALLWVVEHGSLQGASRAEKVSRTTLRRRLGNLESAVGAPIVHLRGHDMVLTSAGRLLVEQGPELLRLRAGLLERARESLRSPQGELKILAGLGFPPPLSAQLQALFLKAFPGIRISLRFVEEPLKSMGGDYDLVVYWGDTPPDREGYSRVFLRSPMQVMASSEYLSTHGTPTSIEDLKEHTIIQLSEEPSSWPMLDGRYIPVKATHRVNDLYVLGCMLGMGIGLGLMPPRGIGVHPLIENLQPVLTETIGIERTARFFAPVRTAHGGPAAAVVEQLDRIADIMG
ncbi:MAG: DNA-binding transcriptional LysR family regulator [Myxococcota bacterium]